MKQFFAAMIVLVLLSVGLGAQDMQDAPQGTVNDPLERFNRGVHQFNKGFDRAILRPVAYGYTWVTPDPVERGLNGAAANLGTPATVINSLLQGKPVKAGRMLARFGLNSTFGLLGMVDVATSVGLPDESSDFGETLHVWGSGEGPYIELPLLGPSTVRDATGTAVDFAMNPLGRLLAQPELTVANGVRGAGILGQRSASGDNIDSVLYKSEDSYTQTRLYYLQTRRFALGQDGEGGVIGPDDMDASGF